MGMRVLNPLTNEEYQPPSTKSDPFNTVSSMDLNSFDLDYIINSVLCDDEASAPPLPQQRSDASSVSCAFPSRIPLASNSVSRRTVSAVPSSVRDAWNNGHRWQNVSPSPESSSATPPSTPPKPSVQPFTTARTQSHCNGYNAMSLSPLIQQQRIQQQRIQNQKPTANNLNYNYSDWTVPIAKGPRATYYGRSNHYFNAKQSIPPRMYKTSWTSSSQRSYAHMNSPARSSVGRPRAGNWTFKAQFVKHVTMAETRATYRPNTTMVKTWRLRNTSPISWGCDVQLDYFKGNKQLFLSERYTVPDAQPGEEVDISATLRTPNVNGRVCTYFRLQKQGRWFGPRVWCDMLVTEQDASVPPRKRGKRTIQN